MKKLIYILALLFSIPSFAQMSGQIGQFDLVPQRIYANPAFQPKAKLNIAIPALGNIYIQHGNNWINPSEFVEGNSSVLSPEAILASIGNDATTTQMVGVELIHIGYRFGKNYIHFRAAERFNSRVSLPVDLFRLAVFGNVGSYQFENNTADFSDLGLDAMHFREYAIGFNRQFTEQLTVGITAKYLYGMEVIQTENSSLQLRTDPNTYALTSLGQLDVNTSGIDGLVSGDAFDIQEYLLGKKNSGFALDLGGTYRPIERLELQLSAHDIGFIRWRDDIVNYETSDATFLFDGVDLTQFLFQEGIDFGEEFGNEADSLLDELESTFGYQETNGEFTTNLNGYIRYGAAYSLLNSSEFRGVGWVNATHGIGASLIDFQVSAGYNQTIWNAIQAGVHMTKTKDLPFTFGGGLSLNGSFFQLYAMVENFSVAPLAEVTITDEDNPGDSTTLLLPAYASDLRVHVGINLTFNRKFGEPQERRSMYTR
ncbi:MAG: DUF5723 family protein [Cryomorphaceae bacterium]